ncbi:hypothetical protein MBLNU230_g7400t1 [Neophaeotheca triangularis]
MTDTPSSQPSMRHLAQDLLHQSLERIVHDIVATTHREHKLLLADLDPVSKLPICKDCNLPKQLSPPLAPAVRGATSDPLASTKYCDHKAWSGRPGHDIYDNPFPRADVTGRPPTKKEREAAKQQSSKTDGTPASEEAANGTAPPSPSADGDAAGNDKKVEKGEKKASKIDEKLKKGEYVPWHTCPSCKRSLLITRFAKHLEQCMGLSGRAASRNAMARMNGNTPVGSRGATPSAVSSSQQEGGGEEEEGEGLGKGAGGAGGVRKKLLKKGLSNKLKKEKGVTNGKVPKGFAAANKRLPTNSRDGKAASPGASSVGEGKREREEEGEEYEDGIHVKKRQKLQRAGSVASIASQSTAAMGELERTESNDGSFVDEGSVVEE